MISKSLQFALLLLTFFNYINGNHLELSDSEFLEKLKNDYLNENGSAIVGKECSMVGNEQECLFISDVLQFSENGKWSINRYASKHEDISLGFVTYSRLVTPEWQTLENLDTKNWEVDVSVVFDKMVNGLEIILPFQYGYLPLTQSMDKHFTILGVATAGFMSFIANRFENIKMTGIDIDDKTERVSREWFGYDCEKEKCELLIEDGVDFVADMARIGAKTSAIFIDACLNQVQPGWICPVSSFLSTSFLNNLSTILDINGFVIINTLFHPFDDKNYDNFVEKLEKHFANCQLHHLEKQYNKMIICANFTPKMPKYRESMKFLANIGVIF